MEWASWRTSTCGSPEPTRISYGARVPSGDVTLQQAADELGVHYMTAYRYVKLGLLYAEKRRGSWMITPEDLDTFRAAQDQGNDARTGEAPQSARSVRQRRRLLEAALVAGDEATAWTITEAAVAEAENPVDLHFELLAPSLVSIGRRWAAGELSIADEHKASAVATRLIARLGSRLTTPGRRRGTVIVGACPGDVHSIPSAMFADILRTHGVAVIDLGGSPDITTYLEAVDRHPDAVVAMSITGPGHDEQVRTTVAAIRERRPDGPPIALGGGAVTTEETAMSLGADIWHADHRVAARLIAEAAAAHGTA